LSSRTSLSLFRPRARTERRWRCWQPRRPLTRRTLMVFSAIEDLLHLLAALGGDAGRRLRGRQALDRRPDQVDRVARADRLGQHVPDADRLEHGAHGATGDHAGTFRGRLHVDPGGTVVGLHRVEQGAVVQVDRHHGPARVLHRLLDGDRDLAGLAVTEADLAGAVADHGQRGEGELTTALDGLGHAVDRDQLLDEAVVAVAAVAIALVAAHVVSWMLTAFGRL